jgi:uncharacterized protein with PIN domain
MPEASFRFFSELNDFLSTENQRVEILISFNGHETVKHLLEALGVPHTEVDVILVNDISVDFEQRLENGDQVCVYPLCEEMDGEQYTHLHPQPLSESRFVLDGHLGKLASYLRLLGFDALYRNDYDDQELAEISSREERILLTRDRGLLKRGQVIHGYCVRSKSVRDQVVEVLKRFNLTGQAQPFSRCARCNGLLVATSKAEVFDRLEPKTKQFYDDFRVCNQCDQVYWKGSHFRRMETQLHTLLELAVGE